MKGFILGILVAALAVGGYLYWHKLHPAQPAVQAADAGAPAAKKRRRRPRGAARVARAARGADLPASASPAEPEPEPVRLSAADLRSVAQGDDLSRPDVLRFDMADDKQRAELGQDQIDDVFRAQENAILDCISRARPDPETYVPGRVTVKFRIQRAGTVRGVRVEAPAILQRGGIFPCIKGVVGRLRFPAAGNSQIVTYPFSLS